MSVLEKRASVYRWSGRKRAGHADKWGRAFWAEGTARTKALRQENTGLIWETARRPLCPEQSEEGLTKVEDAI